MIAPEDATVTAAIIRKSTLETTKSIRNAGRVIIVGFEFAPDIGVDKVGLVRMRRDLQICD